MGCASNTGLTTLNSNLAGLIKSTTVEGTTTASGAIEIPTALRDKAIIDVHFYENTNIGLVYRRDHSYFTCLAASLSPFANTSVKLTVWYANTN